MVCVALVLACSRTPIYLHRPLKPSRAGLLEMRSMLSLIESPGLVERRQARGGKKRRRRDGAVEGGQIAWLGDAEPINFPLQPISHVLSLCPFLLMTHFLCPSVHFQAPSVGGGGEKKERKWRCVFWTQRESAHTWGLSEESRVEGGGGRLLSKFPPPVEEWGAGKAGREKAEPRPLR